MEIDKPQIYNAFYQTMSTLVGQKFGPYTIEKQIGSGGMAAVYLAYDEALRRHVCLKVMSPKLTQDPNFVKRFHREALAAIQLNDPGIVQVLGKGLTPTRQPYLAMEYIRGGSLYDYANRRTSQGSPLTPSETLNIMQQIVVALTAVHQANMVHRDLKPSNILMRDGHTPVLADLGIVAVQQATRLTLPGQLPGTPEYMSPEQVRGQELDGRSDIYALGVILYELLAGVRPFEAVHAPAPKYRQQAEKPQPLYKVRPGLAPQTYRLVHICLEKEPARRYQHTGELTAALHKAIVAEQNGRWQSPLVAPLAGLFSQRFQWQYGLAVGMLLLLLAFWGLAQADPMIISAGATRVSTPMPTAPVANAAAFAPLPTVIASPTFTNTPTPTPTAIPSAEPTQTPTAIPTSRPVLTPLPSATPILGGSTERETAVSLSPCLPDPGPRWGNTLYTQYSDSLNCSLNNVQYPLAAYQIFDKGLMIWREDANLVYILYYHDGTFEVYDVSDVPTDYPNDHDLLKGAFGYLWNTHESIRAKIQNPKWPELHASEFAIQDYRGGTIFYFLENSANNYVLLNDQRLWFTHRE